MINNNQQAVINNTTQEAIVNDSSSSSAFGLQVNATDTKTKINMESNISTNADTNIDKRKIEQKNKFTEISKRLLNMFSFLDEIQNTEDRIEREKMISKYQTMLAEHMLIVENLKNELSSLKKASTDNHELELGGSFKQLSGMIKKQEQEQEQEQIINGVSDIVKFYASSAEDDNIITDVEKYTPNISDNKDTTIGLGDEIKNLKAHVNSVKSTIKDDNLVLEQSEKLLALEEDTSQLCIIC